MKIEEYDVSPFTRSNRIKAIHGQTICLNFMISYFDDETEDCMHPEAIWLRDGLPVKVDSINEVIDPGHFFSSLDFIFQRGDEGVYQCIFSINDTVFLGSYAIRIDSSKYIISILCDLIFHPL